MALEIVWRNPHTVRANRRHSFDSNGDPVHGKQCERLRHPAGQKNRRVRHPPLRTASRNRKRWNLCWTRDQDLIPHRTLSLAPMRCP